MIITDRFVMLNYPKTGSSFTRGILKRLHNTYDTRLSRVLRKSGLMNKPLMTEVMVSKGRGIDRSQHGNYRQIPEEHRRKRIVTVVRNPLQRYISEYLYGWWKEHPQGFGGEIEDKFANFPRLSFGEYYEMISLSAARESKLNIGYETVRFIKFYFKNPGEALGKFDFNYIKEQRFKDDIPDIIFLHQENLNNELYDFLLNMEYPQSDIAFIKKAQRTNVTHRENNQLAVSDFFSQAMKEEAYEKDRLLFALFPEYEETRKGTSGSCPDPPGS